MLQGVSLPDLLKNGANLPLGIVCGIEFFNAVIGNATTGGVEEIVPLF